MPASEVIRRRQLPHWDVPTAAYFVTTCLNGSIPAQGLLEISTFRSDLERRPRPDKSTELDWKIAKWKLVFARTDKWLDRARAARHLCDERLAKIVVDAIYHFAGQSYDLLAYVVMPSHIHWVFQPLERWVAGLEATKRLRTPRERIVHSLNRFTALRCNALLGLRGDFWQHESYDHWIRSPEELERILLYVEGNPVKAGLAESADQWRFSSASARRIAGLELGEALVAGSNLGYGQATPS